MTTPPVCLFCRTSCNCGSEFVPVFITYLKTVNIDVKKYEKNFRREDFHCCEKCGSLLETISRQVQKLEQDLLTIQRITLENLDRNELIHKDDEVLEKLRRQSVSDFTPSISLNKEQIPEGLQPHHSFIPDDGILTPTEIEIDADESDVDSDVSAKIEDDDDVDIDDGMKNNQLDGEEEIELDEFMLSPEQDDDPLQSDADYDPLQSDEDDGNSSPDESLNKIVRVKVVKLVEEPPQPPAPKRYRLIAPKPQPVLLPLQNFTASSHNQSDASVTVRHTRQGITVTSPDKIENTSEKPEIFHRVICSGVDVIQMNESAFKCGTCDCIKDSLGSMAAHVQTEHNALIRFPIKGASSLFQSTNVSCWGQAITKDSYSSPASQSTSIPDKKCDRCDLSFETEASLIDHNSAVHYNGARFVCESCKLGFIEKENHDYHARKCNGSSSQDGMGASEQIVIADSVGTYLGVEIKQVVSEEDQRTYEYECGRCNTRRKNKKHLLLHIRLKHTDHEPFKCLNTGCGFAFASLATLNDHISIYRHKLKNVCEICSNVLPSSRELNLHVLTVHHNLTRYSCSRCGKGFHILATCRQHEVHCPGVKEKKKAKPKPKKPKALDPDEQARLIESVRESIRGQGILSSRCQYCTKTLFGSSPAISLHEKICQVEVSSVGVQIESKWRESLVPVDTGAWVLKNVEITKSQITQDPEVVMYKCGGCNETFKERDDAVKHVK
ncbi:zinc finger protein 16 isoform X3 [Folsomia candida]|nr:zinc finger protein 16 isoform X3 [Folsomia candida]